MGCPHISPQLKHRVEALFADGTCWSAARLGLVYRPRGLYMPLSVLERRERFGGELGVIWLPGQDSNLQPSG